MRATEFINEMDRRGFLGALGAGAMAATGVPAQAKSDQPKVLMSYLSGHIDAEDMLHKTAKAAGIKGTELAQFLAQCYHESAGFGRMHEYASGKEYEGRRDLGNIYRGDGVKYKGRGFIQITGRDNYRRAGQALGLPLDEKPELATRPDVAAKIAVWYWKNRVKPNVSNFNDTRDVTRYINPKLNGLLDRHENFKDYKNMFSMAKISESIIWD
jgi:putative chitinase